MRYLLGMTDIEDRARRERDRVYEIALHDIRRLIETMKADDALVAAVYRRLAKAMDEAWGVPHTRTLHPRHARILDGDGNEKD